MHISPARGSGRGGWASLVGPSDSSERPRSRLEGRGSRACLINLQEPVLGGCWMYLQPEIVALSAIVEVVFSTPRCQGGLRDRLSNDGKPAFAGSGAMFDA